jgi:hypothetical protein
MSISVTTPVAPKKSPVPPVTAMSSVNCSAVSSMPKSTTVAPCSWDPESRTNATSHRKNTGATCAVHSM